VMRQTRFLWQCHKGLQQRARFPLPLP
jgi:hypothetical protein